MEKLHINNTLIERMKPRFTNPEHLYVLGVAVGHIHDILYEEYDDVIHFSDSIGKPIEVSNTTEPDGLAVTFSDFTIEVSSMGGQLIDHLPDSDSVSKSQLDDLLILIAGLYDLMVEHEVEPLTSHLYE